MSRVYTDEMRAFIRENAGSCTIRDMVEKVNKAFDFDVTYSAMRAYYKNHKLHSLPKKGRSCPEKRITTPEMDAFIRDHLKGTGHQAMADLLNEHFGTDFTKNQMKGYYARYHLNSGLDGRFKKGRVPENKGKRWSEYMTPEGQINSRKTQFKSGNIPPNGISPVGTISIRKMNCNKTDKPYYLEKVAQPSVWRLKHHLVWEEHYGPIPEGYNVQFANGDTLDYRIENLVLVSKAQNAVRNHLGLKSTDKETAEAANAIADLKMAISKAKRREHNK